MSKRLGTLALLVGCSVGASTLLEKDAKASFIDVGAQAGVGGRSLAGTTYKTGFNMQLHGDLALIPPILMLGAYIDGIPIGSAMTPKTDKDGNTIQDAKAINFRTFGLRAKLKIPIPGPVTPYGIAGFGVVNADFPDQDLSICKTIAGTSGCVSQKVPNANKWFVEFALGAGLMIDLAGPLKLTIEGAWRPSTGYSNDDYEKAASGGGQNTPSPSRNGYAWNVLGGLAISL